MSTRLLSTLSMTKYERLLPRVFNGCIRLEIHDRSQQVFWDYRPGQADTNDDAPPPDLSGAWDDFGGGIQRRQSEAGLLQFRASVKSREYGEIAWLAVTYDTQPSVPMNTAPDPLRRAFSDVIAFLQEELELQTECNQLAAELTERYEELNLVYSTKDQVEYFEEGQEALARLVTNCADYLDVAISALVCREPGLVLHSINRGDEPLDVAEILELISTSIYDRVESQVSSIVLNEADDEERRRLFGDRNENVLAYPVIDDHGTAIGVLAVVAHRDAHTFSNGDRNLLEVMAKKASRIIHTHHDSLTGLMNRSGFESSLIATLAGAKSKGLQNVLLHVDIDQLHLVNDLMGHQEGDALIRRVAKVLRNTVRDSDFLARLGGDEFGVLLTNCAVERGHEIADKIRDAIGDLTVVTASRQLDVTASIGVAMLNRDTESIVNAMASAEIACKAAKDEGRDRIQVFRKDNTTLIRRSEEIEWIGRVQQALREDRFTLHCQPVIPVPERGGPAHYEMLVRMLDENGEILSPALFLPAAERYQLMPMIDRWVIRQSLQSLDAVWDPIGDSGAVFCINLSGQSLTNNGFQSFVSDEIARSSVAAQQLCFEITETAAISNIDEATGFMEALQDVGCRFALDDFGAGLSSFGYLKMLPVDYLKIDGSFVREVTTDDVSRSMVEAICQIGRTMNLAMIAEYVGDAETVNLLRRAGVDYVQGFHIGKPKPLEEILTELQGAAASVSA